MFSPQAIKQDFSRAAERYDGAASLQRRVRAQALILAENYWKTGANILDLGCGTGALAEDAKELGWHITGIDLAFGMCAVARRHGMIANADACALPFAPQAFDGVFSSLMLQWVAYPLQVFQEMARVIMPRGHCVIVTLLPGTLRELEQAFAAFDEIPHVSHFLPKDMVLAAAGGAELKAVSAVEVTIVDYYPDAESLMRSIKSIGAVNKALRRRKGLMTPQQVVRLNREYAVRFGGGSGIPATWKVLYLVLEKR